MNTSAANRVSLGVVLLAAGASVRMRQPKMLLPWGGSTVIGSLIHTWTGLGSQQIAVVCAPGSPVDAELNRLGFPDRQRIYNLRPENGMFSSITCAAQWAGWEPGLTHFAIVLGDQPHLAGETLRQLIALASDRPGKICQPYRAGSPRHPVLIPAPLFRLIPESGSSTLKEFLALNAASRAGFESEDEGLDLDLDRMDDYEEAKRRFDHADRG